MVLYSIMKSLKSFTIYQISSFTKYSVCHLFVFFISVPAETMAEYVCEWYVYTEVVSLSWTSFKILLWTKQSKAKTLQIAITKNMNIIS